MRIFFSMLISLISIFVFAQDEEQKIREQAKKFSSYLMANERAKVVGLYTADAKIFPNDKEILEGADLSGYWNPENVDSEWKTTFHQLTPVEIKVWGSEAYDYGYYEGTSSNGIQTSNWKGKYVVIWRKEKGVWKMYLDIWNRIRDNE